MSSVVPEHDERFGKAANSLFREYGARLDSIRADLENLRERHQNEEIELAYVREQIVLELSAYERLNPALVNFARRVSQQLEHGDVDEVTNLELQLRLADFEGNIEKTDNFFKYLRRV